MRKVSSFLLAWIVFVAFSCSGSRRIQTQWDYPTGAKLRIFTNTKTLIRKNLNVIERSIPTIIELETTNKSDPYFVEIFTPDHERLYGILYIFRATLVTELSAVKIELTDRMIRSVMENEVSQFTVTDPSAGHIILRLRLGNRIPDNMQKLYRKNKLRPF